MTSRAVPSSRTSILAQASAAIVDELDPTRLNALADAVSTIMPSLADDLRQRARQAERIRDLFDRALAGDLFDD
jgi:hypothetical protein